MWPSLCRCICMHYLCRPCMVSTGSVSGSRKRMKPWLASELAQCHGKGVSRRTTTALPVRPCNQDSNFEGCLEATWQVCVVHSSLHWQALKRKQRFWQQLHALFQS